MEKKYLIYPGRIISQADGQLHFIKAKELMKLYAVNPMECVVNSRFNHIPKKDLINLHPRYYGDYKVDTILFDYEKSLVDRAKKFATEKHEGQKYGDCPYTIHLKSVVDEVEAFKFPKAVVAAAWLHDILEDTPVNFSELQSLFGKEVAELVEAVTDEPGKNRKERAKKTLPKIYRVGTLAIALKLCDRISNVMACIRGLGNVKLLGMYKKEYPEFRKALCKENKLGILWEKLDNLLVDKENDDAS